MEKVCIEEFDNTEILVDTDDKLRENFISRNVVMLMIY